MINDKKTQKKVIIMFLSWLFLAFIIIFIGVINVHAAEYYFTYNDTQVYYDNFGTSATNVGQTWNESLQAYISNNISTANNYYGAAVSINSPIPIIENHTYSMSVQFLEKSNLNTSTKSYIAIGNSHSSAIYNYTHNTYYASTTMSRQVDNKVLQFVFRATGNGSHILIPWTTNQSVTQNYIMNSIIIDDLGNEGVTQQQINTSLANQTTIINNSISSSTQSIINADASNTQAIINSNRVCTVYSKINIKIDNKYLNYQGIESNNTDFGITDYIKVDTSTTAKVILKTTRNGYLCYYTNDKNIISCHNENNMVNLTIPTNAYYLRYSIEKSSDTPQLEVCKNGNQATSDAINDLDNTIKDDDIGGSAQDGADFILDFNTNTFGLTSIVTAPLSLIQSLTSSTCNDLELPLPYLNNKKLTLPCMNTIYNQYFGTFFTMYQTITYGIIAYWVIVRIFNQVKDFKNPEHDEIEVLDL